MEILKDLFAFLTDTNKHFSTRAAIFFALFIGLLLADNLFGFTYYYNISNKIEKAASINKLIGDSSISLNNKMLLISMRNEVLSRETVIETVERKASFMYNKLKANASNDKENSLPNQQPERRNMPARSGFWFVISSSGIYIIFTLITIPFILVSSVRTSDYFNFLLGSIAALGAFYGMAAFNYYVFGLIPLIGGNWVWNYLINFILQVTILGLIGVLLSRSKR